MYFNHLICAVQEKSVKKRKIWQQSVGILSCGNKEARTL